MARDTPHAPHDGVSDSPRQRRYDISRETPRAPEFPRFDVDVLADLQNRSLAEPVWEVDSPLYGMLVWRSCAVY
jgi:hypothetical protein